MELTPKSSNRSNFQILSISYTRNGSQEDLADDDEEQESDDSQDEDGEDDPYENDSWDDEEEPDRESKPGPEVLGNPTSGINGGFAVKEGATH